MPRHPAMKPFRKDPCPRISGRSCRLPSGWGAAPEEWSVREVGDGNLNLVFMVEGSHGSCCVKQSLPYVRLVGDSWPMPLERAFFEHECLRRHGAHAADRLPEIYHYDPVRFCIVMELLSPHIIMRRGMIQGIRYPRFAGHMAEYCARSLFFTSDLYLPSPEKKAGIRVFAANTELCKITEDLIFTEPYMIAERNRWTAPQLDGIAAEFRGDAELKLAVSRLKLRFMGQTQALVHGDLHTGSVMVTESDTRVIDSEFAFYGPMGFDIGAVIGNLLINYFSQDGHASEDDPRDAYQEWVLRVAEEFWNAFRAGFLNLWRGEGKGDGYPAPLFCDSAGRVALEAERNRYMDALFQDSIGFAAAKMIRRILGLAHNIDLEWIEDEDLRAMCETRCLRLARELMVNTRELSFDRRCHPCRPQDAQERLNRWISPCPWFAVHAPETAQRSLRAWRGQPRAR